MLTYNQLAEIIIDSSKLNTKGIERSVEKELKQVLFQPKPLKVITGIRRCGKSFILKRLYKLLLKSDIPENNILFLNFEDDRLSSYLSINDLRLIYDLFISKIDKTKPVYFFLDEIQNIPTWEKFVRTIYDSTNYHIYITGSNAKLLSKEFSSTLGGRILEYTLYPFSFPELLQYRNISYSNAFELAENKVELKKYLNEYLNFGGLSEVFDLPENTKITYRKSLIDKIIVNDIVARFNLESVNLLQNILLFLEKNIGNIVSYRKIANVADANENTVEQYISHLQDAFIIEKLKKFSWKTKAIFDTNKKFFFIDNLFCHYADIEDKLENICYLHLLRNYGHKNIFIGRDDKGKEVDFVVKRKDESFLSIQVCYELTDNNLKRETSSLLLFDKYVKHPQNEYLIIIMYNRSTNEIPKNIRLINISDFLLGSIINK